MIENDASGKFMKTATNRLMFNLFLLKDLPMGYLAGLRVREIDREKCTVSIPYKYLTKNPFRSMYFACLAMAAEMSAGALCVAATTGIKPSVATLVRGIEGAFSKKAVGLIRFSCHDGAAIFDTVARCMVSGEGETVTCLSIGTDEAGDEVARFKLTWSFKARSGAR